MNYKQAMSAKDASEWQVELDEEHKQMVQNGIWEVITRTDAPAKPKILRSVWAMKLKANETKSARLNAKGYGQWLDSIMMQLMFDPL
jgi:hypothetical protein